MRRASECIPGRNSKLTPRRLSLRFFDLRRARAAPASSFFVCVCVDGVTKSRTLVSYKVDISDGSGCDCFLSLFANDAKRGRGGSVRSKKGRRKCAFVECKRAPSPPRPARSRDSHRTSAVVHQPGCVCVCVCVCSSSSLNRLVLRAEPRPPFVRAQLRSKSGNFLILLLLSISTSHQSVSQSLRS